LSLACEGEFHRWAVGDPEGFPQGRSIVELKNQKIKNTGEITASVKKHASQRKEAFGKRRE
jgi:hypothetical protein